MADLMQGKMESKVAECGRTTSGNLTMDRLRRLLEFSAALAEMAEVRLAPISVAAVKDLNPVQGNVPMHPPRSYAPFFEEQMSMIGDIERSLARVESVIRAVDF